MSQITHDQGITTQAYPQRYTKEKMTQSVCNLAVSLRVVTIFPPCFVTPPQSSLRLRPRRQASQDKKIAHNAGWEYY